MINKYKSALNSNINFIQVKLFDFDNDKIDCEKIISERLNKVSEIENINKELFLDEIMCFHMLIQFVQFVDLIKLLKKET